MLRFALEPLLPRLLADMHWSLVRDFSCVSGRYSLPLGTEKAYVLQTELLRPPYDLILGSCRSFFTPNYFFGRGLCSTASIKSKSIFLFFRLSRKPDL